MVLGEILQLDSREFAIHMNTKSKESVFVRPGMLRRFSILYAYI